MIADYYPGQCRVDVGNEPLSHPITRVLADVHALLSEPERWTQRAYHRNAVGSPDTTDPYAVCWCVIGAVGHVISGRPQAERQLLGPGAGRELAATLRDGYGPGLYVTTWQDARGRTHAEVLDLLERTIQRLEGWY